MNDISPVRIGQTDPAAHWNFKDGLGNTISMPIGTVFTLYIYNPATGNTSLGQGSFAVVDLNVGKVDYLWDPADVATAGSYEVYAGYVLPGGKQGFTDTVEWVVQPINIQQ